ncbi:MAG: tRNA (adenosine(37)-N6)-threonylcarbamoyltransferase complex dimerization subunit type 1 TsaB [Candidatus Zixiibacteriota bacterium]
MSNQSPQYILGIDTSSSILRLGVRFGGDRIVQLREEVGRSHGEVLIPKIADLLASAGIERNKLSAIVVCTGPGSFTGLRLGLAAAKGMAVVLNIPVIGVDLFEVAARRLRSRANEVDIVIPLNRDECFLATVDRGTYEKSSVRTVRYDDLVAATGRKQVAGFGIDPGIRFPELVNRIVSDRIDFEAADLIQLGIEKLQATETIEPAELEPLYIQKSQAEIRFEQRQRKK